MRIIHVTPSIGLEASGPSHSVTGLCNGLTSLNQNVNLLSMDWPEIPIHPNNYKFFPMLGPRVLGIAPGLFSWLRKNSIRNSNKILIHNHGMWLFMALYASKVCRKQNIPLIQSPRNALSPYSLKSGSKLKPIFWKLFQKRALESVDCFHATCEKEYEDIRALGFKQPIAIVPNGVDIPKLDKTDEKSKAVQTLTYLGRVHPEKGIETLLTAWKNCHFVFQNWILQIIGPGKKQYVSHLKNYVLRNKISRVKFLDPVYSDEKWRAYQNSDLYILPSPSENFGMTIAESLACGTPVIATTGAPWSELAEHGAGWCVDYGTKSIEDALRTSLITDPGELSKMGERGKAWMTKEFSWDSRAKDVLDVYNWLCGNCSHPPKCLRLD